MGIGAIAWFLGIDKKIPRLGGVGFRKGFLAMGLLGMTKLKQIPRDEDTRNHKIYRAGNDYARGVGLAMLGWVCQAEGI